jgi:hypothetical protein
MYYSVIFERIRLNWWLMARQNATRVFVCFVSLLLGFEIVVNKNELIDTFCCLINTTCCGNNRSEVGLG